MNTQEEGVKPSYISIWHPDNYIGLATIETGMKAFVRTFIFVTFLPLPGKKSPNENQSNNLPYTVQCTVGTAYRFCAIH